MNNLKMALKLTVVFIIMMAFVIPVGTVGMVGMHQVRQLGDNLYNYNLAAIQAVAEMEVNLMQQNVNLRTLVIYEPEDSEFQDAVADLAELDKEIMSSFEKYQLTVTEQGDQNRLDTIKSLYAEYSQYKSPLIAAGSAGDHAAAQAELERGEASTEALIAALVECHTYNDGEAAKSQERSHELSSTRFYVQLGFLILAAIMSILIPVYMVKSTAKPMSFISQIMQTLTGTGNFQVDAAVETQINKYKIRRDEIGRIASSFSSLINMMQRKLATLEDVSNGDLTTEVVHRSEQDSYGNALKKMVGRLNEMFSEIKIATSQVSSGARQIADGSQSLAQGSTEQAASVQQLSASLAEISQKTHDNAERASKAAELSTSIKLNAQKGSEQMDQMMQAVQEITESSNSISKVIKVIDDIAFQTNILALNAAVEAARAGQHGKGFAVVAEEVRNLAAKSAEAAKDTGSLIANSVEKAHFGAKIADETAESLNEIVSGINESTEIVKDIARSSEEQSLGIMQINTGLEQVAQVVHQNSATSEQSAAASEEMSGLSDSLDKLVSQFKLRGH